MNQLHKDMVQACAQVFPNLVNERILRKFNLRHRPLIGTNSIPDLAAPDRSVAIECETFSEYKSERFRKHDRRYKRVILVIPFPDGVDEIWVYRNGQVSGYCSV